MSDDSCPKLSVVITTPEDYQSIETTIQYLRKQTVRDQIELVIVGPSAEQLFLEESLMEEFWGYQVVCVGPILSIARANAEGIGQPRGRWWLWLKTIVFLSLNGQKHLSQRAAVPGWQLAL